MFNIINIKQKNLAIKLRKSGFSLSEIKQRTGISKGTLSLLLRDVELSAKAKEVLNLKNFKSKNDSETEWNDAALWSQDIIGSLSLRDKMLILGMIYWGEGTKKELNIINSDPTMLAVFIACLREFNIDEKNIRVSLRLFPNCDIEKSKMYWSSVLKVDYKQIIGLEFVEGTKKHKHEFGMCRIRVKRGGLYFKKIMSIIRHVKMALP